jgi:hypothetical protein
MGASTPCTYASGGLHAGCGSVMGGSFFKGGKLSGEAFGNSLVGECKVSEVGFGEAVSVLEREFGCEDHALTRFKSASYRPRQMRTL